MSGHTLVTLRGYSSVSRTTILNLLTHRLPLQSPLQNSTLYRKVTRNRNTSPDVSEQRLKDSLTVNIECYHSLCLTCSISGWTGLYSGSTPPPRGINPWQHDRFNKAFLYARWVTWVVVCVLKGFCWFVMCLHVYYLFLVDWSINPFEHFWGNTSGNTSHEVIQVRWHPDFEKQIKPKIEFCDFIIS